MRILYTCLDDAGIPFEDDGDSRVYDTGIELVAKQHKICEQQMLSQIDIKAFNRLNADAFEQRFAIVLRCLEEAGFELGAITPFDQTIENPELPMTANWNSLMSDKAFQQRLQTCDSSAPPPDLKSP